MSVLDAWGIPALSLLALLAWLAAFRAELPSLRRTRARRDARVACWAALVGVSAALLASSLLTSGVIDTATARTVAALARTILLATAVWALMAQRWGR